MKSNQSWQVMNLGPYAVNGWQWEAEKRPQTTELPMKQQRWVSLDIKNVMGVKAVRLERKGAVTTIGGKNKMGKSSVIKTIWMILGGAADTPDTPLRDGARKGGAVLELDDYLCEMKLSAKGNPRIVVKPKDGSPPPPPATFLKALTAGRSFNPVDFYRVKADTQLEVLKKIVQVDTSEIDLEKDKAYNLRRDVNSRCKALEAQLNAADHHTDVPAEEQTASELLEKIGKATKHNRLVETKQGQLDTMRTASKAVKEEIAELAAEMERMKKSRVEMVKQGRELAKEVAGLKTHDVDGMTEKLADIESVNVKVRDNKRFNELESSFAKEGEESAQLTHKIDELKEQREKMMAETQFPITGLSFGDGCVLYNSRPLDQASGMERMRVSVAIGAALNPGLRLLTIDDEEKLDQDEHANLVQLAEEGDYDLIVARVSCGAEVDVIIEEGEIKTHE